MSQAYEVDFDPLPRQRLAIEAPLGPVLVVAGPGAGKTFCLIARIGYLIRTQGFRPERICAVTFTNKAAEEIAHRLRHTLGEEADEITRGTLHSLCIGLLREQPEAVGLRAGFGVADEEYQRRVLGRLGVFRRRHGQLLTLFGRRRLQGYTLTDGDERLFRQYQAYLRRRNVLDFDDIIVLTRELLASREDVADAIAARWDYILVDEFQDLNQEQYEIVKRLAQSHRNIFAVGDDEQSIYSWAGADPRVLVRSREDFRIDEPIVLDRNCRCSQRIFEVARRALAGNPTLFDKDLVAERPAQFDVVAVAFPNEEAEARWIVQDIQADQEAHGLGWGDYGILYRKHEVGYYLESRLIAAGIPCRLARGQSAADDEVIGFVVAALRVMRDPADPAAVDGVAARLLPPHLLQELHAVGPADGDMLESLRSLARGRPRKDPDTKKLWRFIYQVENLSALYRSHRNLAALVDDVLSRGLGPYRNPLEEHHDELTDPADLREASVLATRIAEVIEHGRAIEIEAGNGLGIALRGLLLKAGIDRVSYGGGEGKSEILVLRPHDGAELGLGLALFKALQLLEARDIEDTFRSYVAFDLETTDDDPAACEIIEIGAAKVVDGVIVDQFHTLVRPNRPISFGAQRVHGRSDADVRDAPAFEEVWPRFFEFARGYTLVAHNGQRFDVPVLRRLATGMRGAEDLGFFDTLPLARSLSRDSARLSDLATRFGIHPGRAHHALDDAVTLAQVFLELRRQRLVRARKSVLSNLLDFLGLALVLDAPVRLTEEHAVLGNIARIHALGRFTDCLEFYASERERVAPEAPTLEEIVERLGGKAFLDRVRATTDPAQRFPEAVARLRALMDVDAAASMDEKSLHFLERVALSTSEGVEVDPDRVNLLTLHSTKGLEFSRVYILGVEDYQLPGYWAAVEGREDEIQEARRLLYVGMTRAKDRLILTHTEQRGGRPSGAHAFLDEISVLPTPA